MKLMPDFPAGPCAETDPELFFPERWQSAAPAVALCRPCESRLPCLRWALGNYEEGVWGGFSERSRGQVRAQIRAGASLEDVIAADDAGFYAREDASAEAAERSRIRRLAVQRAKRTAIMAAQVAA